MTSGRGFLASRRLSSAAGCRFELMLGLPVDGRCASPLALNIQGWGLPVSSYVIQMTRGKFPKDRDAQALFREQARKRKQPDVVVKSLVVKTNTKSKEAIQRE